MKWIFLFLLTVLVKAQSPPIPPSYTNHFNPNTNYIQTNQPIYLTWTNEPNKVSHLIACEDFSQPWSEWHEEEWTNVPHQIFPTNEAMFYRVVLEDTNAW